MFLFFSFFARIRYSCRIRWLDPLVRRAVEDKRQAEKAGINSPVAEKTFLQHLADSTDGTHLLDIFFSCTSIALCPTDPVLIRDQLLSVLLASRDTVRPALLSALSPPRS